MKRSSSFLPLIAVSALFTLFIAFSSTSVDAIEINVPKDFATIQAAISSRTSFTSGDSIVVAPGTYDGPITLPNNITIKGTETARTILTGNGGPVMTLNGNANAAAGQTGTGTVTIQNFTFINASIGIGLLSNTVSNTGITVNIMNNVFQVGTGGTAISEQISTLTKVINNTFYLNGTALICDWDITISNNIFSNNSTAISDTSPSIANIVNNFFFSNSLNLVDNSTTGSMDTSNLFSIDPPLFVDLLSDPRDFHLQQGSPCIGAGNINGASTDIGAYGGSLADTIPFPVSGLTITATTDTSIGLTWLPNKSYLVTNTDPTLAGGYNLYVGPSPGSYTGALTSSGTISSPINVALVTGFTLTGLTPATAPPAPDKVQSSPRDSALVLTWSAVPGATGYKVHYGINSVDENVIDTLSAATSYELQGLTNGQLYLVAVSAYSRLQYFFNVTAYDNQFVKGSASAPLHESKYLSTNERSAQFGPTLDSLSSSPTITDFPEVLITYPNLPDSGRCFIATAAYGYYSAPEVQALRAFRDRYLLASAPGRMFVEWYYRHGPAAAAFLNDHPAYKPVVRAALMPAVGVAIFMTGTSTLFKTIAFLVLGAAIAFGFLRKRPSTTGGLR